MGVVCYLIVIHLEGGDSLLFIVTSQRERFKQRNVELETVKRCTLLLVITHSLSLCVGVSRTETIYYCPPQRNRHTSRRQRQNVRKSSIPSDLFHSKLRPLTPPITACHRTRLLLLMMQVYIDTPVNMKLVLIHSLHLVPKYAKIYTL